MRGTVSPCHMALSKDTRLLVRVRPCGQEQPQVFGYEPQPDAHTALVRFIIHHSRGSRFAWPRCLRCMAFLFARTLHLPARTLPLFLCSPVCLCQSACDGGHRVPARACSACAGPSCVNALHLFARAFPVPARLICLFLADILIAVSSPTP